MAPVVANHGLRPPATYHQREMNDGAGTPEVSQVAIRPLVDEGLGNSSYLVDLGDGRALIVDPTRDIGPYVDLAAENGLQPAYSLETHLHADFVSGSRQLARLGGTILAPRAGGLQFDHVGLDDEQEIDLGGLTLRTIGSPGHTPEHLAYLLLDGSRPVALFSGGALLVGSVARTDLISPEETEPLAHRLFRALRDRIMVLPDELPVYPTHGAGSFCSAPGDGPRTTTIGRERAMNPLLGAPDEETFARWLAAGLGTYPTYFRRLREVNRRGPTVYAEQPRLAALSPEDVARLVDRGAEVVDARPVEDFAAGHLPGALSIALRPSFASWLGWLLPMDRSLVFVLDPSQDRADLVRQCLKIGYEKLAGELDGGMTSWRAAGLPEARTERVSDARDLTDANPLVVDVRQTDEWVAGHVPGATHVELGSLSGVESTLGTGEIVLMCGHGERATTAASLVERAGGHPTVFNGGPEDWSRQRREPLASGG
jgi:glyoxylase-like metal-dependent hydrolase (beta-lactamase superfamily II)/rhodanese-related sulfurtransferase